MKLKDYFTPKSYVYTGANKDETVIKHYHYNATELKITNTYEKLPNFIHYIQVVGLSSLEKILKVKDHFPVDPLVLEDVLNVNQRNKIEDHKDYVFAVFHIENGESKIVEEYMSVLLFEDTLISFHEKQPVLLEVLYPLFDSYTDLREKRVDFLFYQILDIITDHHLDMLDQIDHVTEAFEEDILENKKVSQEDFYRIRKTLLKLKSNVSPIQEQLERVLVKNTTLFQSENQLYYDDLKDHLSRLDGRLNDDRELMRHLLDLHINNQSNNMNKIMKTLTLFSAIFIPLSFLTGFFGMNFHYFNILDFEFAVPLFVLSSILLVLGMLWFFRRMNWFK